LKKLFPSLFLIIIILFTLTSCNSIAPPTPQPDEHDDIADSYKVTAIAPYYEKLSKENITA